MSSETSTKKARRERRQDQAAPKTVSPTSQVPDADDTVTGFQPWHLFVIGGLLASAVAAVAVRGTRPENVIFVSLTVLASAAAAYAFYRTLWPLVHPQAVRTPDMLGGRTRAALEREKVLVLRAIKELEFDRAMGKVSDADCQEMIGRLRSRAVRLIKQLDSGGAAYHDLIERELAARVGGAERQATRPQSSGTATRGAVVLALVVLGGGWLATPAQAQMGGMGGGMAGMPDAKAMSGIPRPSETVPNGAVSVRLVRGQMTNLVVDFPVTFTIDGKPQTVKTDATGHAVANGLAAGASVQASATVDGEKLDSQVFQMPAQGGVVLMLVASDKTAAEQMSKAAVPGTVRLAGQSRIIMEFQDEELQVFYLFDLVNDAPTPVKTDPIVFELPKGAVGASVMEGSAPNATAKGPKITVTGPFAPGTTSVQVGFQLPPAASLSLQQVMPVAIDQVAVMIEKAGDMTVSSPNLVDLRQGNEGGKAFIVANGPGLKAGQALSLNLNGLPHHPTWPRNLALALAVLILGVGAWMAIRTGTTSAAAAVRTQLEARREQALADVMALDRRFKAGELDETVYEAQRAELMTSLERIYGELDTDQGQAA